ncbi:unnamed protein product, partial [Prunus brigantina]
GRVTIYIHRNGYMLYYIWPGGDLYKSVSWHHNVIFMNKISVTNLNAYLSVRDVYSSRHIYIYIFHRDPTNKLIWGTSCRVHSVLNCTNSNHLCFR